MLYRRNLFSGIATVLSFTALLIAPAEAQAPKKGVMLMNRIGPSASELYIANADGGDERKLLQQSVFDYHAAFSADGKWVVFTSERDGLGQANIYRARIDGSSIERLTDDPAVDDQAVLSPDGKRVAFVSTRGTMMTNIWVLDLESGRLRNLTADKSIQGAEGKPQGFFRPAWSPNGKWLAFSSDRNTEWRGHEAPHGWEQTQELSIYVIGANGKGFRRVASKPGYCLGSPHWSANGKRILFYETTTERTAGVSSQVVSIDVKNGARQEHTASPGFKVAPQFVKGGDVAYLVKGGPLEGLYYTAADKGALKVSVRSPVWSPDGSKVIYEKVSFQPRPQNLALYSWDPDWDYKHTDVFPTLSRDGKLAYTRKAVDSSIVISNPDGSQEQVVFDTRTGALDPKDRGFGLGGAFQPTWSPDGEWIAFGLGYWFQERRTEPAMIVRIRRNGTVLEELTDGSVNSGFPSYSADGRKIVYRVFSEKDRGLRILDLPTRATQVLTTEPDNLPGWSPDGSSIVFTRRVDAVNFDIFTIRPDGTDLRQLTTSGANDGHGVWSADGKQILWSTGAYGFRDEASLYDRTFQQYGQIWIMNADGTGKRMLTDSPWEDSMPLYLPTAQ